MTAATDGGLLDWLAKSLGWPSARATVERIGEGHSREMLIVRPEGASPVVVRIEQGGVFGTTSAEECRVMKALKARGVAVAEILADDAGSVIGRPLFVMEFVDGVERPIPTTAFVDRLHALHTLPVDDELRATFDRSPETARDATFGQIDRWYEVYRSAMVDNHSSRPSTRGPRIETQNDQSSRESPRWANSQSVNARTSTPSCTKFPGPASPWTTASRPSSGTFARNHRAARSRPSISPATAERYTSYQRSIWPNVASRAVSGERSKVARNSSSTGNVCNA